MCFAVFHSGCIAKPLLPFKMAAAVFRQYLLFHFSDHIDNSSVTVFYDAGNFAGSLNGLWNTGHARPFKTLIALLSLAQNIAGIGYITADSGCHSGHRTHQISMTSLAHLAYKIAVVGGHAHVACRQRPVMLGSAKSTGRVREYDASFQKSGGQPFPDALQLYFGRAGSDDNAGTGVHLAASGQQHIVGIFNIFVATIGTGADMYLIHMIWITLPF